MTAALSQHDRHDAFASWLIVPLVTVLTIVLVVFYGLFNTTRVQGGSMLPTLKSGDMLLQTKSYPRPIRGDIVVVQLRDQAGRPHDIVKRIIGLPGDTVQVRNDIAWINGSIEPSHEVIVNPRTSEIVPPVKIPEGRVFVMGDNRPLSLDSRYTGTIAIADIQGKVKAIFAPINRIRRIN